MINNHTWSVWHTHTHIQLFLHSYNVYTFFVKRTHSHLIFLYICVCVIIYMYIIMKVKQKGYCVACAGRSRVRRSCRRASRRISLYLLLIEHISVFWGVRIMCVLCLIYTYLYMFNVRDTATAHFQMLQMILV